MQDRLPLTSPGPEPPVGTGYSPAKVTTLTTHDSGAEARGRRALPWRGCQSGALALELGGRDGVEVLHEPLQIRHLLGQLLRAV